ncbi:hypothetical protein [Cellulomonas fimi]|uniref:hypothetical protein n=1 Tax=Cellulomonas fimi TaxID=1708 RepID=UPI002011FC7A|nr:hypothetical protein [Cellulomonas fimi]
MRQPAATRIGSTTGPDTSVTALSTAVAVSPRTLTSQARTGRSNTVMSSRSCTASSSPAKAATPTTTSTSPGTTTHSIGLLR